MVIRDPGGIGMSLEDLGKIGIWKGPVLNLSGFVILIRQTHKPKYA